MKEIMKQTWRGVKIIAANAICLIGIVIIIPSEVVHGLGDWLMNIGVVIADTTCEVPDFSKTMKEIADA